MPLKSLVASVLGRTGSNAHDAHDNAATQLFTKTDPATDGEACLHDCDSCTVRYPRGFSVDLDDRLYGQVKGWSTHMLVATGKADWVRDVADEKGSVMEAVERARPPGNGRLMLSASNIPTPHGTSDYGQPTTVLLLPAFTIVSGVQPRNVGTLMEHVVSKAPTTTTPLSLPNPPRIGSEIKGPGGPDSTSLRTKPCPHAAVILMCSQRTRDARCGQSAPLLRRELERHLRPLGLFRDAHDERPGGVGIYFISHVGGHKYSANVMVYRRANAFGQDDDDDDDNDVDEHGGGGGRAKETNGAEKEKESEPGVSDGGGAAQGIWLARIRPEDCENLVRYTVLKGKVVKPESQLRGGFDRVKGLTSW